MLREGTGESHRLQGLSLSGSDGEAVKQGTEPVSGLLLEYASVLQYLIVCYSINVVYSRILS